MSSSIRLAFIPAAVAVLCSVVVAAVVLAGNRGPTVIAMPSANSSSTPLSGILTTGDAVVSKKPDLATVSAGVQSQQSSAAAAQSDLATKLNKLVSRIKSLGVADKDLSTSGYWVGPVYSPGGETVTGYRAGVQLSLRWHNVDTVGKAVDAIVQEGGATNISVGFGLNDPRAAQTEARSQAIADARSRAEAMASAAGVKLGPVMRVVDLSSYSRSPMAYDVGAAAAPVTKIPVGEMDVQVSVEVDFALG
ncbi:MAG TPA: SIMPL domain-containing protein [Candidatus Dormibacteraeota bacterium]|nr:SIMPL domain-containing protein [Candidatus Dormibacteraeota bacterium]